MKKRIIILVLFSILALDGKEKWAIDNDGTGFFVNFSRALNHLHHCRLHSKTPIIYWGKKSSYYDENGYNGSCNAWEYYFEPVSHESYEPGVTISSDSCWNGFSVLWDYHQYIDNLNLLKDHDKKRFIDITHRKINTYWTAPVNGKHIYDQEFRSYVKNELIDPYIKVKSNVQKRVDSFFDEHMRGKRVIGVHLRGKHIDEILPFVPIQSILQAANSLFEPETIFFIATDQYPLIEEAQKKLKGNVIFCDIERFTTTTSPTGSHLQKKLHPKLGEDVLVEALLLAKCDFLVHTISTLSTAVLYFNPSMEHICLY